MTTDTYQPKHRADGPPVLFEPIEPGCAAVWPDAWSGEYDPRCCRFPKSCSATVVYWPKHRASA